MEAYVADAAAVLLCCVVEVLDALLQRTLAVTVARNVVALVRTVLVVVITYHLQLHMPSHHTIYLVVMHMYIPCGGCAARICC